MQDTQFQRKSNHSDDSAKVLHTEYRLEALKHRERQRRTYTKRAQEHWDELIKAKRGKKRGISYSKTTCIMPSAVSQTEGNVFKKAKKSKEKKKKPQKKRKNYM